MTGLTIKKTPETALQQMSGLDRIKIPRLVLCAHRLVALCTILGGEANSNLTDFWI